MAVVGVVLVGAGYIVVQAIRVGDDAERQTMAMQYLRMACVEYIRVRHGWPRSWEDLASVEPGFGHVEIPRDLEWVGPRVRMNFGAKLEEIARETPQTFSGFGPSAKAYYDYKVAYEDVIEAAKSGAGTRD